MTVRLLGTDDAGQWLALMKTATATHPAAFLLSPKEVAAMTDVNAADTLGQGRLRGLFDGDRLIGFGALNLWQLDRLRHRADIGPFYVAEAARGTGGADRLMQALVDAALEHGVVWLDLWVAASNGRARGFYRRNGFEEVARRVDAIRLGETSEDDVLMTRRLSS